MKVRLILLISLLTTLAVAQTDAGITPSVTTAPIEENAVSVLHLSPGYTTSVRLPEEISSVVIGDPARFKAEHSEAEARLVFLRPITAQPSESNALITTKSGQEISLHLVSAGKTDSNAHVDFFIDYRRPHSFLINSDDQSFLIADTGTVSPIIENDSPPGNIKQPAAIARQLERQQHMSPPAWQGKEVSAALGDSIQRNQQTILGFSILNRSQRVVELLPPQLQLSGTGHGNGRKRIKAEPIVVSEYHMTMRRLAPGQRADGVVVFERPAFKESTETLQLQLAEAEEVDRPILLSVPFTSSDGGSQ
jgi:hypothetical protein